MWSVECFEDWCPLLLRFTRFLVFDLFRLNSAFNIERSKDIAPVKTFSRSIQKSVLKMYTLFMIPPKFKIPLERFEDL